MKIVGYGLIITAGTIVTKDVLDNIVVRGVPAKILNFRK